MSKPPVWVSQNFLTSRRIISRLLRKTSICADDHVVEIGPGKGHITGMLLPRCKMLSAIELDKNLHDKLRVKFAAADNLRLYHRDFLQWPLPGGDYKVFANIPFCHTTDILRKLTECSNPPREAWLIMEKGAAKRFMGQPRESLRSLAIKPKFDMRVAWHFQREDFHPMPRVDVVMLHLKRKPRCDIPAAQWRAYQRFIAKGFAQRKASGDILYIQWLHLFRKQMQKRK